jgi:hypothetical protein
MGRPIADLEGGEDTLVVPMHGTGETVKIHMPSMSMEVKLVVYHHPCVINPDRASENRLIPLSQTRFRDHLVYGKARYVFEPQLGDIMIISLHRELDGVRRIYMHPAKPDLRAHFD